MGKVFSQHWLQANEDWKLAEIIKCFPCDQIMLIVTSGGEHDRIRMSTPVLRCMCVTCSIDEVPGSTFHEYVIDIVYLKEFQQFGITFEGWIERHIPGNSP